MIDMKKGIKTAGILWLLSLTTALGQDKTNQTFAASPEKGTGNSTRTVLSVPARGKSIELVAPEKAPDKIVGKRLICSGPLVALIKSDNPLRTFNPFVVSKSGVQADNVRLDPYLPPPRGITLFSLKF